MIAPLKTKAKPDADARLAFAACALGGHCFIGWRHGDILRDDIKPRGLYMTNECQGFVDQHGYFWSREVSSQIACAARQIGAAGETIMSEELWDPDGTPRDGWKPDAPSAPAPAAPATSEADAKGDALRKLRYFMQSAEHLAQIDIHAAAREIDAALATPATTGEDYRSAMAREADEVVPDTEYDSVYLLLNPVGVPVQAFTTYAACQRALREARQTSTNYSTTSCPFATPPAAPTAGTVTEAMVQEAMIVLDKRGWSPPRVAGFADDVADALRAALAAAGRA